MPPAAAAAGTLAATAYLDARLGLGYDISLLRAYGHAGYAAIRAERRGQLSPFHELEALALSRATADDVFLLIPSHDDDDADPPQQQQQQQHEAKSDATTTTQPSSSKITLTPHTYASLHRAARRHAAHLRRRHRVRRGDVVALDMANGARFVTAWFAVWALGAVPAFVNCHLRGAALLHCIAVSTARVVLVEDDGEDGKYADGGECMPLYHTSASLLALLSSLFARTPLALGRRFSARRLLPELHATRATHLQYVGETLRYLLATPPDAHLDTSHRVHTIFGNGLRPDVWRRVTSRFAIRTVAEFYAATEGPGGMWNKSCNGFAAGAVGRAGWLSDALLWSRFAACVAVDPSTGAALRDPSTNRCIRVSPGAPGELLFKLDPNDVCRRFQGYFGDEHASSAKVLRGVFEAGDAWFATGDVLRRDDAEGRRCWRFVDRLGDTFRWKGENVSTAEVAALLADACHDDDEDDGMLRELVVYGVLVPGQEGRAGCAAVVVGNDGGGGDGGGDDEEVKAARLLARLAEAAARVLPRYAVPLFVRVKTSALAVTGTNKPQKHLLQKDGIDPDVVEAAGDRMYWLRDGRYERLGKKDYERIQGGGVKL
ncbi:putative long-chain fatty acid [Diplodia seriata]|uniref:Putative long-chain fatty acid n=1 Tax=Diplodia seriata TaxID=420778 RepID=A0A0G2GTU8_9PEZI|nr:putative long-chain fatty acid [Diplodia seriata]